MRDIDLRQEPRDDPPEPSLGVALRVVQEEGGMEAMSLVADLVERNHRNLEATYQQLYEAEQADHERTKRALDAALHDLAVIRSRITWLLDPNMLEPWDGQL